MATREEIINSFYNDYEEDKRLVNSRHGQLEFITTMHFIHKFLNPQNKIIEIGAGTGRYSIGLAKEGYQVSAIELVENNLKVLKENSKGIKNIESFQGDATDLSRFEDNLFDLTLSFGPLYHLYDKEEINKAIDEAIRITKPNGIIMFAFIPIYGIMDSNYLYGNWEAGMKTNYTSSLEVFHTKEQLFTGYDIVEFENLFKDKNVEFISTVGIDSNLESLEKRNDFSFSDKDFESYIKWHLANCEKRELLGRNNHLLYICRKK